MSSPHAGAYTATSKTVPLPQPIKLRTIDSEKHQDLFWAAAFLNDDGELQAIKRLQSDARGLCDVTIGALYTAQHAIKDQLHQSVQNCLEAGGILFAWHGSKAFEPGQPASGVEGGATQAQTTPAEAGNGPRGNTNTLHFIFCTGDAAAVDCQDNRRFYVHQTPPAAGATP